VGATIQMPKIEVDHLVSTVRFNNNVVYEINDQQRADNIHLGIKSLSENIDTCELDNE